MTQDHGREVETALDSVLRYGALKYPVGEDRSHLCHAAIVLAAEVRRLRVKIKNLEEPPIDDLDIALAELETASPLAKRMAQEVVRLRAENKALVKKIGEQALRLGPLEARLAEAVRIAGQSLGLLSESECPQCGAESDDDDPVKHDPDCCVFVMEKALAKIRGGEGK